MQYALALALSPMPALLSLASTLAFDSLQIRGYSHIRVCGQLWRKRRYRATIDVSLNFVDFKEQAYKFRYAFSQVAIITRPVSL